MAFGQVRPRSGPQNVVIQRRVGLGRWIVEASLRLVPTGSGAPPRIGFPTDADGFFQRQLTFRPGETYRTVWTAGDRVTRLSHEVTAGAPRLVLGDLGVLVRPPG